MFYMIKVLLSSLIFIFPFIPLSSAVTRIKTQQQFDVAVERINAGLEMNLCLAAKTFFLNKEIQATAPLSINGYGATIMGYNSLYEPEEAINKTGDFLVYCLNNKLTLFPIFINDAGKIIGVSESVDEATGVNTIKEDILVSDFAIGSSVRIPISNNLSHLKESSFDYAFGYLDCGWQVILFRLEKSDNSYFYCKTLNSCRTGNLSYDLNVYKKGIRYVIFNAEKQTGKIYYDKDYIYIPKNEKRVYQVNCRDYNNTQPNFAVSSDFYIKNVRLLNLDGVEVKSKASDLCEIKKCSFENFLGCPLRIDRKEDLYAKEAIIENCTFFKCSLLTGVVVEMDSQCDGSNHITMRSCTVSRYPDGECWYKNPDGAVWANGNVTLLGNVVYNTPRCHIYCGKGKIIVKGNVLYNDDRFNSNKDRNLSCDMGLIYCNHLYSNADAAIANDKHQILLENNLLYGAYSYANNARGIFIDDGRGDVICKNNIIFNTQLYSLDSRNISHQAASVRNVYEGNIVTSRYRLAAGLAVKGSDIPKTKANLLLNDVNNIVSNSFVEVEDSKLNVNIVCILKDEKVCVSKELYMHIKKSPAWKDARKHVKIWSL